ncbi:MAG: hypothetical protein Q8J98_01430 [Phaeovulum sp.]|uniref:hypothetical protein n=1 Tax=Phaeovulum sp. TaxID=2934796 RepID=UPI00272F15A3|nr:hypothetical protein [Phaeovulum sp.]MDP2061752.1 hypothetical protein [Phaeovulum sp.]
MKRGLFWLMFALMAGVYGAMLIWTLPQLKLLSGGLLPFDLRPGGYDLAEAQALLAALGADGRAYYLGVQQSLDSAYPALYAVVMVLAFRALVPGWWGRVLGVLVAAGAGFDYLENARVAVMLRAEPQAVTEAMVAAASQATVIKSVAVAVALVVLSVLLARAGGRRWWRV